MDHFSSHRHDSRSIVLEPSTTAVLVVDMLNDFCAEGGLMVLPGADVLYGPQNAVLDAARAAGAAVVYVNDHHRPSLTRDREFLKRMPHCIGGTWGAGVVDALEPKPGDLEVLKHRYSGFFQTDLDLTLKDNGITTVVVMGVVTNICVRSTVHDAFFLGYSVVVPADCVAATGPREQESSLYDIGTHFGWVTGSSHVVASLSMGVPVGNEVDE